MKNTTSLKAQNTLGKVPPQVIELEESVIGALLLEKRAIDKVSMFLTADCFYNNAHGIIFKAISALNDSNRPIDIHTVSNKLKNDGLIDSIGGMFYLAQLTNKVASTAHIEYHGRIIFQKYIQRELIRVGSDIQQMAFDDFEDVDECLNFANKSIDEVSQQAIGKKLSSHVSDIGEYCLKDLEARIIAFKEGGVNGIPTGLYDLNTICHGWKPNELIILAARPAMGKTALMLHHAYAAAKNGNPVCIYSLEMSDISLVDRIIIKLSGVNADDYTRGNLKDIDYPMIEKAIAELKSLPIYIDDNAMVSMRYIKSHARMMKKKGQCDLIIADYLQLVDMNSGQTNRNRENDVSKASREAKIIAKELKVPFIVLSQLSRNVEMRAGDKRPQLSDLRESGSIEQDADMVIFIHRPEYYGINENENGESLKGVGKLILAKHRKGKTGDVIFKYNESLTRIFDFSPIEDDNWQGRKQVDYVDYSAGLESCTNAF